MNEEIDTTYSCRASEDFSSYELLYDVGSGCAPVRTRHTHVTRYSSHKLGMRMRHELADPLKSGPHTPNHEA